MLMHTLHPPVAIALGLLFATIGFLPEHFRTLPSDSLLLIVPIAALIAIPFAYWLPIARAKWMHNTWRVPRDTYVLSRRLTRLMGTAFVGMVIGSAILSIWIDSRYALLCVGYLEGAIAFIVSASRRFKRHPASEFVMPLRFPYPLRKRM